MSYDRQDIATASTDFPAADAVVKAVSGPPGPVVPALFLAGALATFLVRPTHPQGGGEPLSARFPADTGPSDHGGAGQTFSNRIRCSEDISAGY